jgi:hypothetical protein
MAKYSVPPNTGKVRVAVAIGGKWAVWNGRQGKNEFRILVRNRKQAEEVVKIINEKRHDGEIEVWN